MYMYCTVLYVLYYTILPFLRSLPLSLLGTATYGYEHTQTPTYNYTEQSGGGGTYGRGGGQQRSGFPYQSR